MTKKPHSTVCVKNLRWRGCLPKLKMEKRRLNVQLWALEHHNEQHMPKVNWAFNQHTLEKGNGLLEKGFSGWKRILAVLEKFKYNDFVQWTDLFLALSYPVNIFHEFISAMYSFRKAFAFEKSLFISVIADYPEEEKKSSKRQCPSSHSPKTRVPPCTPQPKCSKTSFRQENQ